MGDSIAKTGNSRDVYVITCNANGKKYVGSSSLGYAERYKKHLQLLRDNKHIVPEFQKDFNKYGEESFSVKVIGNYSCDIAYRVEYLLMDLYKTRDVENGYNCLDKSGHAEKDLIHKEITKFQSISYLTDLPIEELLKDYNVPFVKQNVVINFRKIKTLASERGMTVCGLEKEIGFSHNKIQRWNKKGANVESLYRVAKYLGVKMDDLVSEV